MKPSKNRHGSESRDVGRVSQRSLGRSLARRPSFRLSSRWFGFAPQSSHLRSGRKLLSYSPWFVKESARCFAAASLFEVVDLGPGGGKQRLFVIVRKYANFANFPTAPPSAVSMGGLREVRLSATPCRRAL
jgi:hypothetical protein